MNSLRDAKLQQLKNLKCDLRNTIEDLKDFYQKNNEFTTKSKVFYHIITMFIEAQRQLETFVLEEIFPDKEVK